MALTLVFGNKNYSSWSLRPWIAMKATGIAFEEVLVPLHGADFHQRIARHSPAGKVPILIDGDIRVWESLAILEYLAEKFPAAGLWPADRAARAHARVIASEMHAGFQPLRRECPMNVWRPVKRRDLSPEAVANVRRIDAMWSECRSRFGQSGPFLFGKFSAADAMYAPVVSRLVTYDVPVSAAVTSYMDAIQALPAWIAWRDAALRETWVLEHDEVDWPTVLRVPAP